ncbi:MAG: transcription-repair coupling factor [Sedimentisphaerales bacterium]|nr:transcription-repair coupling factor [Sedimentisphaerales bacterium]
MSDFLTQLYRQLQSSRDPDTPSPFGRLRDLFRIPPPADAAPGPRPSGGRPGSKQADWPPQESSASETCREGRDAGPKQAEAHGCWGSLARLLAGSLANGSFRPILYVTAHITSSYEAQDDLEVFTGRPVELLSAHEIHQTDPDPASDVACERLQICRWLWANCQRRSPSRPQWEETEGAARGKTAPHPNRTEANENPPILVAPIASLIQPVPSWSFLQAESLSLDVGRSPVGPVPLPSSATREPSFNRQDPDKDALATGMDFLISWLVQHGFQRVDQVDRIGEFAVRGGILDIFPPDGSITDSSAGPIRPAATGRPLRVEFFGDEIESIRFFDLDTQRSVTAIEHVSISGCRKIQEGPDRTCLLDYLPGDCLVILEETLEIVEVGRIFRDRTQQGGLAAAPPGPMASKPREKQPAQGEPEGAVPDHDSSPPEGSFPLYTVESILQQAQRFDLLHCNRFAAHGDIPHFDLAAQSLQRWEGQATQVLPELIELAGSHQIYFFCETAAQQERLREILLSDGLSPEARAGRADVGAPPPAAGENTQPPAEASGPAEDSHRISPFPPADREENARGTGQIPANLFLLVGLVHRGFALPDRRLCVVTHHELFAQFQQQRRIRKVKGIQAIETFTDLEKGDLVVHVQHGIGRFRGLKTLIKNGRREEFLTIEYAHRAQVHLSAGQIHLVHKYVGCRAGRVKLARLGSAVWEKQKQKVGSAIETLAAGLIEIQALRQTTPGVAYPPDTHWQREFEESFSFQDTDDQISANADIKKDLQESAPMDRLLCGDVGYGKTELAIRAAFKVAEQGKQVLVLVPTTVLADQHYRTFRERLADFPFNLDVLSRFKTPSQARDIIQRLADGQIDILIGTHRLLSGDVRCRDLGLVIIDEEQRFGVEHKERLKQMRATVDVLTMTATPIPRTLHLALLGIRSISSLATPPLDRRSIVTEILPYQPEQIRRAILNELVRDGQVFFVHNRVHNIDAVAGRLQALVPEARILIAHGQLSRVELEQRMLAFVRHQSDILVCTTIIESGLDIPNANTIFINDADRFGLAELHQLRGRVGRYKNRAYAYMLLPSRRAIHPTAVKRLKAIEEYSQLGSGFRIALRDLEIRGAGNILGVEQSGHIDAVGYELYCRMLSDAVRRIRRLPEPQPVRTHLELDLDCHIPAGYIGSERQRLEIYRRLAQCSCRADLERLERDLHDLFGAPPVPVGQLLQLTEIRLLAAGFDIRRIVQKTPDLIFTVDTVQSLRPLWNRTQGRWSQPEEHTVYLRLPVSYFDRADTLLSVLRKLFQAPAPKSA